MYGLDFGEAQRVETRRGTAYVREAAPTQLWRSIAAHDQDVGLADDENPALRKNRLESGQEGGEIVFGHVVEMAPLAKHTRRRESFLHALEEFKGEERGNPGHPGIRGLRDHDVP